MVATVRSRLTPEQIAAGLGNPGIAELVALVHQVNPTGRGLDPDEQARRYLVKSRLQSRLIREWGDHLDLHLDGALVSIAHRGHRDAAHVPLGSLDPDARERVCRALDVPDEAPEGAPEEPPALLALDQDPLAAGRRALEDWDYPTARARFEEAFAVGRGEPAAHALLALLVDHLGSDEEALALDVFPGSARVTRLLAVAHARTGDPRKAAMLLRRLTGTAECEVRLLLAERALRSGPTAEVRTHLDALRALDPANGALTAIGDALRNRESEAWAPLEAALAAAVGDDALRSAAEALLDAAPAHPEALSALAAVARRQEQTAAAAALAAAELHAATGRWDLALVALERAREHGADVASLKPVRTALAAARAEQATADTVAAVARGDLQPYVRLTDVGRSEVRARCSDPRLERVEQLIGDRVVDPVGALGALEHAEADVAAGRPETALARLGAAHLADVPSARTVVRAARAACAALDEEAAIAGLARLRTLVGQGEVVAAMTVADTLEIADLPEPARAEATALRAAAVDAWNNLGALARVDRYLRDDLVFAARTVAEERVAQRPSDGVWAGRLEEVEDKVRALMPTWVETPWHETAYESRPLRRQPSPDACLEADGRHAWLTESVHGVCFLRRIEVATGRVGSCTVVQSPVPFRRARTAVFGSRLCLVDGGRALLLRVEETGVVARLEAFVDLSSSPLALDLGDPGRDPEGGLVASGRSPAGVRGFVWCDVSTGRQLALPEALTAHQVSLAGRGRRLLVHARDGSVRLMDPRRRGTERLGWARSVRSIAVHPTRDELVVLGRFDDVHEPELALALLDPTRRSPRQRVGLGHRYRGLHQVATSRVHGVLYVSHDFGVEQELQAYDGDLRLLWSVAAPSLGQLITDTDDNHVAIQVLTTAGPRICALGREPLVLPPDALPYGSSITAEVDAAMARFEAAPSPAERFAALDVPAVWCVGGVDLWARLAKAAAAWTEGPLGQRIHAMATCLEQHRAAGESDDGAAESLAWLDAHGFGTDRCRAMRLPAGSWSST